MTVFWSHGDLVESLFFVHNCKPLSPLEAY